ncbi:hypothetical protein PENSPDRAFT_686663 [Peniophora sp. CONT]|nr:hypothetical protein PENSPDRAFT_686663 [Peniophora sp. CONT]
MAPDLEAFKKALRDDPASALSDMVEEMQQNEFKFMRKTITKADKDREASLLHATALHLDLYVSKRKGDEVAEPPRDTLLRVGKAIYHACISTNFPLILAHEMGHPWFWTRTQSYKDDALTCLWTYMRIYSWGCIGTKALTPPPESFIHRMNCRSTGIWTQVWKHRADIQAITDTSSKKNVAGYRFAYGLQETCVRFQNMIEANVNVRVDAPKPNKHASVLAWSWGLLPYDITSPDNTVLDAAFELDKWEHDATEKRQFIADIASLGADSVMSRLVQSMSLKSMYDDMLNNTVYHLDMLPREHLEMRKAFDKLSVTGEMAAALHKRGPKRWRAIRPDMEVPFPKRQLRMWIGLAQGLDVVSEGLAKGTRKPDTASGRDIYTILQDGLYLLLDAPDNVRSILNEYEPHVKPIFSQWVGYIRKQKKSPSSFPESVIDEFREAAKESWHSILTQLRDASKGPEKTVINFMRSMSSVWAELGVELGLEEESTEQFCSWTQCQWHNNPSAEPLRNCSGCSVTRYCSRECQISDWKQGGHKAECRRLQGKS